MKVFLIKGILEMFAYLEFILQKRCHRSFRIYLFIFAIKNGVFVLQNIITHIICLLSENIFRFIAHHEYPELYQTKE